MVYVTVRASDKRIACDEDLSDSEDEGDGRKDEQNYKTAKRPKTSAANGDSKQLPEVKPPADAASADKPDEAAKPAADTEKQSMETSSR